MMLSQKMPISQLNFMPSLNRSRAFNSKIPCLAHKNEPPDFQPLSPKALEALEQRFNASEAMNSPIKKPLLTEGSLVKQPFPYQDAWDLVLSANQSVLTSMGIEAATDLFLCQAITLAEAKLDIEQTCQTKAQLILKEGLNNTPIENAFTGVMTNLLNQLPSAHNNNSVAADIPGGQHIQISQPLAQGLNRLASKMNQELHQHNAVNLCNYLANLYVGMRSLTELVSDDTLFQLHYKSNGQDQFLDVSHIIKGEF